MVGVINPNSTHTLAKQVESAKNADFEVAPGGKTSSEGTGSPNAPEATDSALFRQAQGTTGRHLSAGVIATIVMSGICSLFICFFCLWIWWIKPNRQEENIERTNPHSLQYRGDGAQKR
jgi:hypothetical protein